MCTLGDEYTVSIVRNYNIQLFVPAGRAWTVIFCSTAPRPPVGLLGTTGISTDFALSQYSLSISIFINHNVVLSSSTGQWTRLRYCWWGEIYPAAASKAQRRLKSYRDDRRQTDIYLIISESTNESSLLAVRRRVKACYGMLTLQVY